MSDRSDKIGNHNGQADLAMSLIACLGVEDAVRACRQNGWEGVLAYLLALQEQPPATREE